MRKNIIAFLLIVSVLVLGLVPATTVGANSVPDGVVGWWHFDEGSGTTAYDSSGNSNHGTLVNGATFDAGISGQALKLDGFNDIVTIPHSVSLNTPAEITVEAWIKADSLGVQNAIIRKGLYYGSVIKSWGLDIQDFSGEKKVRFFIYDGAVGYLATSAPINTGEWYYIVGTYDGVIIDIYLNGSNAGTTQGPHIGYIDTNTEDVVVGLQGQSGYYFDGLIDEVRIWNKALTAAEVADLCDDEGPIITATIYPTEIGQNYFIPITVDDTTTGGSNIALIETKLDDDVWYLFNAQDGAYDEMVEELNLLIPSSAFPTAGIYNLYIRGTDIIGNQTTEEVMLVVYDLTGGEGHVTGGGWIYSDPGAYIPDPTFEGKATFGFVSKYKKGASTPDGQAEFQFKTGNLNFHSTNYQWLVVNQGGTNAQFKGSGTINGDGEYKFMIWAGDDDPDTFRIKIWEENGSVVVVYDNGTDQEIGGGSIVIHKK